MEGPANTVGYFIAGYAIIFGTMALYLATLVVRWRNLLRDEAMLRELEESQDSRAESTPVAAARGSE
jgi:hypothetical protein